MFALVRAMGDAFDCNWKFISNGGFDLDGPRIERLANALHRVVENLLASVDEQDAVAELFRLVQDVGREDDRASLRIEIANNSIEEFRVDGI